jgi:hypothetical protein
MILQVEFQTTNFSVGKLRKGWKKTASLSKKICNFPVTHKYISEVFAASIIMVINLMLEAASNSETSVKLHGKTTA